MGSRHALPAGDDAAWLHRIPAQHKVAAALLLVLSVVATPTGVWWPYAVALTVLLAGLALTGLRPSTVLRRMTVEIPFLLFAAVLPFVAHGERSDIAGLSLSEAGLLAAGAITAKATIGVLTAIVLASTTSAPAIVSGLQKLRLPAVMVGIASFMVRYLDVIVDDSRRMRIARESRGFAPSHIGHLRAVAAGAGTLFVRSYERGERVHLAMLSRGYGGILPDTAPPEAPRQPVLPLYLPVAAVSAAVALSWLLR